MDLTTGSVAADIDLTYFMPVLTLQNADGENLEAPIYNGFEACNEQTQSRKSFSTLSDIEWEANLQSAGIRCLDPSKVYFQGNRFGNNAVNAKKLNL